MEKIVGFDIGESSVKLVYFAGADLKKAVTAELRMWTVTAISTLWNPKRKAS